MASEQLFDNSYALTLMQRPAFCHFWSLVLKRLITVCFHCMENSTWTFC